MTSETKFLPVYIHKRDSFQSTILIEPHKPRNRVQNAGTCELQKFLAPQRVSCNFPSISDTGCHGCRW